MIYPAVSAALLLAGAPLAPGQAVLSGPHLIASSQVDVDADASAEMDQATPPSSALPPMSIAQPELTRNPGNDRNSIVVTARKRATPGDPLEKINTKSFAVAQDVDRAVVGPVALGYKKRVPEPIRNGLRNFLNNLHEPDVFLNFLVQLHPGKAAETLGRFAINSTIGAAGLFDVAKRHPFKLPRRPNGFGDTMGYYGVKPGPFLFLPLIGATTLRDAIGGGLDRLVLPLAVGAPFNELSFTIPTGIVSGLDHRIDFDDQLNALRDDHASPYAARRALYLQQKKAEIEALHFRPKPRPTVASEAACPTTDRSFQPALQGLSPARPIPCERLEAAEQSGGTCPPDARR